MEELLKLLNEYEQLNMCRKFDSFEMHTFENSNGVDRLLEDTVISARYGFIKRLVDNDKIGEFSRKDVRYPYYLEDGLLLQGYGESDSIVMLLAISDNPIDLLCERLK